MDCGLRSGTPTFLAWVAGKGHVHTWVFARTGDLILAVLEDLILAVLEVSIYSTGAHPLFSTFTSAPGSLIGFFETETVDSLPCTAPN